MIQEINESEKNRIRNLHGKHFILKEQHSKIATLMGIDKNLIIEQETRDKIKELKDAIKREKQNKKDAKKLDRKGKREARQKARKQKKALKAFQKLCSKFPDAPECSDKDKFVKDTEQEIKQVEVDTKDVEDTANDETKPNDNVDAKETPKETSKICNLKGDTKWEYKVENEEWYTRKKGTSDKWTKLAGDEWTGARARLDKGCPGFRKTTEKQNTDKPKNDVDGEEEVSSVTIEHDPDSWKSNIPGNDPKKDAEARQRAKEFAAMGYTGYRNEDGKIIN